MRCLVLVSKTCCACIGAIRLSVSAARANIFFMAFPLFGCIYRSRENRRTNRVLQIPSPFHRRLPVGDYSQRLRRFVGPKQNKEPLAVTTDGVSKRASRNSREERWNVE